MKQWLAVLAAILVLVGLIGYITRAEPIAVSVVTVNRGTVENTVANTRVGTVKACLRSRLSLPIGGQVSELNVTEGDKVVKGQLLIALWNDDRKARYKQSIAMHNSAEKEKDSICIAAKSDKREAKRLISLVKQNLASAEKADMANARAESSAASCEAAFARIKQAEAEMTLTKSLLDQTYLYAPFDGTVAEVTGELGEYTTPSPPGVATPPAIDLITDDCHYISAPIDEVDASEITSGLPARVTFDAFKDRIFPAKLRRVAPYILEQEKQARTVEVEAELDQPPPESEHYTLLAGYSADIEIILDKRENVVRLPSELILEDSYVLVINDDDELEKREIQLGLSNWHYTEILGGLTEGDEVVSNVGSKGVTVGANVAVTSKNND